MPAGAESMHGRFRSQMRRRETCHQQGACHFDSRRGGAVIAPRLRVSERPSCVRCVMAVPCCQELPYENATTESDQFTHLPVGASFYLLVRALEPAPLPG